RIKDAIAADLRIPRANVGLISIVNGYMHYLATREEYQAQFYEGGSTIYGPGSADAMRKQIVELARTISTAGPSPRVRREAFWTAPLQPTRIGWNVTDGFVAPTRRVLSSEC